MSASSLYAATTQGWHRIDLETGITNFSGRASSLVTTIAVADRAILATCPELAEVHCMMGWCRDNDVQVCES